MPDWARTMLQRDDEALIVLAQEAVQVLEEAELWAIQPVGLQHMLHNLRLQHMRALLGGSGTCSKTLTQPQAHTPQTLKKGNHEHHWEIPRKDLRVSQLTTLPQLGQSWIASAVTQQGQQFLNGRG